MKKTLLSGLFCLATAMVLNAQSKNDPGLSANNYKHPNKAAFAAAQNLDGKATLPAQTVQPTANTLEGSGNYKGSFYTPANNAATVVATPEKGKGLRSTGNYKAQSSNISTF